MFRNLLNPENPLMIIMSRITDSIFLTLFWIMGCIPVITVGASFAALYDSVYRAFRCGERNGWQRFLATFKNNWKAGIVPGIVFGALIYALVRAMIFFWNSAVAESISWMLFAAIAFIGVLVLGILSVLFPLLSRFENSFAGLLKNTLLLALANLPRTLGLGLINAAAALLCIRFVFPVFFLPALAAFFGSYLLEPMFKPYMPDENAAG